MGRDVHTSMDFMPANQTKASYSFVKDRWPILFLIAVVILFPLVSQS